MLRYTVCDMLLKVGACDAVINTRCMFFWVKKELILDKGEEEVPRLDLLLVKKKEIWPEQPENQEGLLLVYNTPYWEQK